MKNTLSPFTYWQLSIFSGIIVGCAYLPLNLGCFVYFGFIPLLHVWINGNMKTNFKSGYIFGLIYNVGPIGEIYSAHNYISNKTFIQFLLPKWQFITLSDNLDSRVQDAEANVESEIGTTASDIENWNM